MTFCASETGLCHALTGLKICFGAVLGALPRAGMFSPFRALEFGLFDLPEDGGEPPKYPDLPAFKRL